MSKHQNGSEPATGATIRLTRQHNRLKPLAACIRAACLPASLALLTFQSGMAVAGPQGEQVAAGQGNISRPDVNTTLINQQSHNLSINWNTFNVQQQELVQFNQPSKTATALNRIFDQNPSQIFGSIRANGNVLLLNPSGIFFSPTATVNVNSIIASSLDISDQDFLNGNYKFNAAPGTESGLVVNQGVIQAATGGSVTLMGGAVSNEGVILANAGQVNLVAGNQVTMDFDGDGLMQFAIDKEVLTNAQALDSAVNNSGTIEANGGAVLMKGSAAAEVFSNVVNNSGVVKAGRIENQGGVVRLVGTGAGSSVLNTGTINVDAADATSDGGSIEITGANVTNTGTLSANSTGGNGGTISLESTDTTLVSGNAIISATSSPLPPGEGQGEGDNGKGGTVQVLGDTVALLDMASIDVSGAKGGGVVLVGGDFQGKNTEIQNSTYTYVGDNTFITADATESGDGGKVIVWSDGVTRFYGDLSATGGAVSGNGGFAEISGKGYLDFIGTVDLSAPNGAGGDLLFDPTNITFSNAADSNVTGFAPPGDQTHLFADAGAVTSNFRVDGTVGSVLLGVAAGTITFQATQDITITDNFVLSTATGDPNISIVLQAGDDININASLVADTTGSITMTANDAGGPATGAGDIIFGGSGSISSVNGDITLNVTGGTGAITGANISTSGTGDIFLSNSGSGGISIASLNANAGASDITITNAGATTQTGAVITNGLELLGAGSYTLTHSNNDANTIAVNTGDAVSFRDTNSLTVGTVNTTGITTTGDNVTLQTGSTLSIDDDISLGAGNLTLNAGGAVTQGAGDTITAAGLELLGAGSYTLADTGNNVTTLAANTTGSINYNDANNLTVGTVNTVGITTAASTTDGVASGSVTLSTTAGNAGAINILNNITTGNASVTDVTAAANSATSGSISITADMGITGIGRLITGNADITANQVVDVGDSATSGTITLNVTGAGDVAMSGSNALTIGSATANDTLDTATTGNITIGNTNAPDRVNNGMPVIALDVSFGTATGGVTTTAGVLNVTTEGGAGALGAILITSGEALRVGALATAGTAQNVSISTTGGAALTVTDVTHALSGDNVTFDSATGTLTIANAANDFNIGAGNLTLRGDEIDLNGGASSIDGITGSIAIETSAATTSIDIGSPAGGTGTLDFSDTDIAALQDGFTSIIIGRADGQHAITVGSSTFVDPVTIQTPVAGSITVNGTLSGTGNASITLDGSGATTTLSANITTEGDFINISDSVVLAANTITLNTTAGGQTAGANIDIAGTVNADNAGANDRALTLNAGTGGAISIVGNVGASQALAGLTITDSNGATFAGSVKVDDGSGVVTLTDTTNAADIDFAGGLTATTLTTAAQGYDVLFRDSGTIANDVTFLNTGTVTLGDAAADILLFGGGLDTLANSSASVGGTIRTSGDQVDLEIVSLIGNATVDTTNAGGSAGANINLTSTVDADDAAANDRTLTVNAGTGTVTISSTVGATQKLAELDVTGATINLNGASIFVDDDNAAAATSTFTGAVVLGNSVTIDGDKTANDSSIIFTSTINADAAANDRTLTVTGGTTGTVQFGSSVGVTQALADLDVTGSLIRLGGNVTTDAGAASAAVTFTGAVQLDANVAFDGNDADAGDDDSVTFSSSINADVAASNRTLTLNTGTDATGTITVTGNIGNTQSLAGLTITQSDAATFAGSVNVTAGTGTVTLTDTDNTIAFQGGLTATTLTTAAQTYNISLTGSGTITNDVTFLNTGTVTLGDAAADILLFDGGLDTLANSSASVGGTIRTSGDQVDLEIVSLIGNATVDTTNNGANATGANINLTNTVNADSAAANDRTLTVNAGTTGIVTFSNTVGATQQLADLDVTGMTINLNGTSIRVDDDNAASATATITGAVVVGNNVTIDTNKAAGTDSNISFSSTINADNSTVNDRAITLTAGAGNVTVAGDIGNGTNGELEAGVTITGGIINLQGINTTTPDAGAAAGNVTIDAMGNIVIAGDINAAGTSTDNENGGIITIDASSTNTISLQGIDASGDDDEGVPDGILINTVGGTGVVTLNGDLDTRSVGGAADDGRNIIFGSDIKLGTSVSMTTTATDVDGDITFDGKVDGTTDFTEDLTLTTGDAGDILFNNLVGTVNDLGDVIITSGALTIDPSVNGTVNPIGNDEASTDDTFLAKTLTVTASGVITLGGATGTGGDIILQGVAATDSLDLTSGSGTSPNIVINSNIVVNNGNILLTSTSNNEDIQVGVAGLPNVGDYSLNGNLIAERRIFASGDITTVTTGVSGLTILTDANNVGAGGIPTVPFDGKNTVLQATNIAIVPAQLSLGTNLDDTVFPHIAASNVITCSAATCYLGDGSNAAPTFTDAALLGFLGASDTLFITHSGGVEVVLDMNSAFFNGTIDANLVIISNGAVRDNTTTEQGTADGLGFQSATGSLTLTSAGDIGLVGDLLTLHIDLLTITSTAGNDVFVESDPTPALAIDTTYNIITGGAGGITVTQHDGDLLVSGDNITTTGNVVLTAVNGSIDLDPGNPIGVVTGNSITLVADTGIGIALVPILLDYNDATGGLSLTTTSTVGTEGDIYVDETLGIIETGDLTLVTHGTNAQIVNIGLTATNATGDISLTGGTFDDTDDVTLVTRASTQDITYASGTLTSTNGTLTLNSAGTIDSVAALDATADVSAATLSLISALSGIGATSALEVTVSTQFNADTVTGDDGAINVRSVGNLPIGLVDAGAGAVTLASTTSMTDQDNSTTNDIFGSTVNLTAVTGIGATGTNAQLEIIASTINATNSTSGGIFLNSLGGTAAGAGPVNFNGIHANGAGNMELDAVTATTLTDVDAANGTIDVDVTGAALTATDVQTGTNNLIDLTTVTSGDITAGLVNAGAGTVNVTSAGDIDGAVNDAVADIAGGTINLVAAVGGIGVDNGGIDVTAATTLNADTITGDDSNILIDAVGGDVNVGLISAGAGNVTLAATGDITQGDNGTADIVAANLTISTSSTTESIGTSLNKIDTNITNLTASTGGTGGIFINELSALALNGNLSTQGGAIELAVAGTFTGGANTIETQDSTQVNNSGAITIVTGSSGNIVLTGTTVNSSGANGLVNTAGRNAGVITLNAAGTFTSNTTITVQGGNAGVDGVNDGTGFAGGAGALVDIDAGAGAVTVSGINTSGGNASSFDADDTAMGGMAGAINLTSTSSADVTLNGTLTALGGTGAGGGLNGANGTVTIVSADAVLDGNVGTLNVNAGSLSITAAGEVGGDGTIAAITDPATGTGEALEVTITNNITAATTNGDINLDIGTSTPTGTITLTPGTAVANDAIIQNSAGSLNLGSITTVLNTTNGDSIGFIAGNGTLTIPSSLDVTSGGTVLVDLLLKGTVDIVDGDGLPRELSIQATNLSFQSGSDGGATTLNTTIAGLTANIDSDNDNANAVLTVNETNAITLTDIDTSNDDIIIDAANSALSNITVVSVNTGTGDVTLNTLTSGGAIVDGNATATPDIIADALIIDATTGVGSGDTLETTVASIDIDNATSGNIEITETNGLTVTKADQATDNDANDIIISSTTGAIAVSVIEAGAGATGDVTLVATGAGGAITDINGASTNITANVFTVDAAEGVGSGDALETTVSFIDIDNSTSGNIEIAEFNGVGVTKADQAANSDTADIIISTTSGGIVVTVIEAGTGTLGDVTLTAAAGNVSDGNGAGTLNVTADVLTIDAGFGVNLDTTATTIDIDNSTSGDITIRETNGVTINNLTQATAGNISLTSTTGTVTVAAGQNGVNAAGAGTITLFADGGNAGVLAVNDTVISNTGNIMLRADDDVTFGAGGDVSSTSGNVEVTADVDNGGAASGALTMVDGTVINAGSGLIDLNADENIAIGSVQTASASATAVTIDTAEGAVTDAGNTDVDIVAAGGTVVINAVTGVGSGDALETTIATLDVDNSTSGNIEILETNGLTVTNATQATNNDANDIVISSTTGAIAVTVIAAGTGASGDVTLTATGAGGAVTDTNGAGTLNVTADVLTIDAATGVDLDTTVTTIDIDNSTSGDITIRETNGVTINNLTQATAGNISLTSTTGTVTVAAGQNGVNAAGAGTITLFADGGNAGVLAVNDTVISNTGNIMLRADDDVTFGAGGDVSSTSGNVEVTADVDNGGAASGALTMVDGTVINAGSGLIDLNADENIAIGSVQTASASATAVTIDTAEGAVTDAGNTDVDIVAAGGTVVINAVTGVGSGDALETTIATLDVDNSTSGNIEILETNGLTVTNATQATNNDANDIVISSTTGAIAVTVIAAGTGASGDVTLTATGAGGAVTDTNGAGTLNVTADVLTIDAATGVDLDTTVTTIDIDNSTSGDITIRETNGVTINNLTQATAGNISLTSTTGTVTVAAGQNGVNAAGAGTITLFADGGNAGVLAVNDTVISNTGNIMLRADDDVTFGAGGDVSSTSGNVEVTADVDNGGAASGALTMVDGTVINAGSGLIDLNADENIAIGSVQTASASATAVTIDTAEGAVTDAGNTDVDIVAAGGTVVINAVTGVGSGDALETTIATLDVDNSTSGNIEILETNGLTVTNATQATNNDANDIVISSTTGAIAVTVIAAGTGASGDVTLTATGAGGAVTDTNGAGTLNVTADVLTIDAATGVDLDTQITSVDVDNTGVGAISLRETDGLRVTNATQATNNAANDITISSTMGDILIAVVDAKALGDVTLTATAGAINETGAGDAAVDILANLATLTAQDEIGGTGELDIETTVVSLDASSTLAGNIVITETDGITLTAVDTANGAITVNAGGLVTATSVVSATDNDTNDIIIMTTTGDIDVTLINAGTLGDVTLDTNSGAVDGAGGASITADDVDIDATTGIGNGTALNLSGVNLINADTTAGNIDITNAATAAVTVNSMTTGGAGGTIDYVQTGNQTLQLTSVSTTNGDVTLDNSGGTTADITIGVVTADTTNDIVTISSTGAIDDDVLNPEVITDVTADTIDLDADEGIGAMAHVDLRANSLSADTMAGAIDINMSQASTPVDVTSLTTTNSTITFNHTGNLSSVTFGDVTTTGVFNIVLNAFDDITVTGTVSTGGGDILINADNDGITDTDGLFFLDGGTLQTSGAGTIQIAAFNFNIAAGSVLNPGTGGVSLIFTEGSGSLCLGLATSCATDFDNTALGILSGAGALSLNIGDNVVKAEEADLGGATLNLTSAQVYEVNEDNVPGGFTFAFENATLINLNTSGGTTGTIGGNTEGDVDGLTLQNVDTFTALTSADAVILSNNGGVDTTYDINTQGAGAITIVQSADNIILSNIATTSTLTAEATNGTLSDVAGFNNIISVGGLAKLTADTGGITLITDDAGDVSNFGSLTFNSAGTVSITENSATILAGTSTADVLDLNSGGSITDDGTANLTVTNNADFADTGGAGITLDDTYSFGTLTFNSTGSVFIEEANAMVLSGTSTAGTLVLDSVAAISDNNTASVAVTGLADFDANNGAASITLNDTYNFGSLNFTGAAVDITEADAMDLDGTSTATTLTLTSTGDMTDTGNVVVTGVTTLNVGGFDITLDSVTNNFDSDNTGDALNVANSTNVTITDANSLIIGNIAAGNNLTINVDAGADEIVTLNLGAGTITAGGIIQLNGNGSNDTLVATNTTNNWTISGANSGDFDDNLANIFNFNAFGNIVGGTGSDTITFDTAGLLAGSVNGGTGIDELIGDDDGNDFIVTGAGIGTLTGKTTGWSEIESITGGSLIDTFTITTGTLTGTVNGAAGTDTLSYAGGPAATIATTGSGSIDGVAGTATSTGGFDNINGFIGSSNNDSITINHSFAGEIVTGDGANTVTLNAAVTGNLTGGTGIDTFTINDNLTGNLLGGLGNDVFNIAGLVSGGTVEGGDGANTFNLLSGGSIASPINVTTTESVTGDTFTFTGGSISGNIHVTGNATWNPAIGVPFTSGPVTGTGNVQIPVTGNVTINGSLPLTQFSGFAGHLIVGGSINPIGPTMTTGPAISITAGNLSLSSPLTTQGNITLFGTNIDITQDITAGGPGLGELVFIGASLTETGSINASNGPVTLSAGSGFFLTDGTLNNSTNLILNFGGGPVEVATGTSTGAIQFGPGSNATGVPTASAALNALIGALSQFGTFNVTQVVISNPAADLIGLEELGFIDTGLFEEDLTLFGVIGNGIALALAQCEEIEGCAPNVTDEELTALIAQLEARIAELTSRCDGGDAEACALLEGYKQELASFMGYRDQLKEYLTAGEEELADEFTEEFDGGEPVPGATPIDKLARMLEGIKARISWLETLKADPEARAKLGEKTGMELTQEVLDAIIEGAKAEAKFIEKQIEIMKGVVQAQAQAQVDRVAPLFSAEAADYSKIKHVSYGPSLLNLNQNVTMNEKWY